MNKANNLGVELEARALISSLTGSAAKTFWDYVTVYSNLTLIKSSVDVSGVAGAATSTRPLQGQSPYIINAGIQYLNYERGISFTANYNKVGQRIAIVGTTNEPDIWENGRDVIDLQVGKSFLKKKNLDVRFNLKDLLAQKQFFFQDRNHNEKLDQTSDNLIWVTTFGRTYSFNVSYKF